MGCFGRTFVVIGERPLIEIIPLSLDKDNKEIVTQYSMEPLGEKLGPILVQLPASFERTDSSVDDVRSFFESCSREIRLAIEFRHRSWHEQEVYDVLRGHGVSLAWIEWRKLAPVREVTADFLYLRWLGNRRDIEKYDRIQIDRSGEFEDWETAMRRAATAVESMYGYFNNHFRANAVKNAVEVLKMLKNETTLQNKILQKIKEWIDRAEK